MFCILAHVRALIKNSARPVGLLFLAFERSSAKAAHARAYTCIILLEYNDTTDGIQKLELAQALCLGPDEVVEGRRLLILGTIK